MREIDKYTYKSTWSEADGEYVGLCVEFPSLSWLDKAADKAFAGIQKLVKQVLSDMKKSGEKIPEPLSVKTYSGKFMVRVPPEVHKQLALEAAEEKVSLNRLASARLVKS